MLVTPRPLAAAATLFALLSALEPPPAAAQPGAPPPKPVKLTLLPFFTSGFPMEDKSLDMLQEWTLDAIKKPIKQDFSHVTVEETERQNLEAEVLQKLPTAGSRGTPDLLSPVCDSKGSDGALAFWIEPGSSDSYRLVSLLYLPDRIGLNGFTLSANLERSDLPVGSGGLFEKGTTKDLVQDLLARNLTRIQEAKPEPSGDPTPAPPPPDDEGVPAPPPPDDEGVPAPPPPSGGSGGPLRLGVLEFSRDFIQAEDEVKKTFSGDVLKFKLGEMTEAALRSVNGQEKVVSVRSLSGDPVSYDQVAAPVLMLDPNADPKAKEKRLLAQADAGLDGLVFGHLHQASATQLNLYLRILTRQGQEIVTSTESWPVGRDQKKKVKAALARLARSVLEHPTIALVSPVEYIEVRIPSGATVYGFSQCYGEAAAGNQRVMELLANKNGLVKIDDIIKAGELFKLLYRIEDFELDESCKWVIEGKKMRSGF